MSTLAHSAEFFVLRALFAGVEHLSWDTACKLGERIGAFGYSPLRIRRRVVERQIAAAFPELDAKEVARIARGSYEHLGRSTVETTLLARSGARGILDIVADVQGWEHIARAQELGRGLIVMSGHHGNWELAGGYIAARGMPIDVIVRRMANPFFDVHLDQTRGLLGMRTIPDAEAVKRAPRALREGRAVGFVADQGVLGLASTFVSFFGRPAKTARGAGVFALRFDAPAIFIVALRRPDGRYRIVIEPVTAPTTGDRERDVDAIIIRFTRILEEWVRRAPEQYFWHHRRWKRQPPGTPAELRDPVMMERRS